jgi:hypothetical protein
MEMLTIIRKNEYGRIIIPIEIRKAAALKERDARGCLKTHCTVQNAPLCGILRCDFRNVTPLRPPNCALPPTKWNLQAGTSCFQTHTRKSLELLNTSVNHSEYAVSDKRCDYNKERTSYPLEYNTQNINIYKREEDCVLCSETDGLIEIKGYKICSKCSSKLMLK